MRRLLPLTLLVALLAPAAATARPAGVTDGTLSVKDGHGVIIISGRGGVIGSFAKGNVTITDPIDGDGTGPIVNGDEWSKDRSDTTTTWGGSRVRFRMIGGAFRIVVRGRGINLSYVGKATVTLNGAGSDDDGTYSVNGGDYSPIPDFSFSFPLSALNP
jgi:hypothetical protein